MTQIPHKAGKTALLAGDITKEKPLLGYQSVLQTRNKHVSAFLFIYLCTHFLMLLELSPRTESGAVCSPGQGSRLKIAECPESSRGYWAALRSKSPKTPEYKYTARPQTVTYQRVLSHLLIWGDWTPHLSLRGEPDFPRFSGVPSAFGCTAHTCCIEHCWLGSSSQTRLNSCANSQIH